VETTHPKNVNFFFIDLPPYLYLRMSLRRGYLPHRDGDQPTAYDQQSDRPDDHKSYMSQ